MEKCSVLISSFIFEKNTYNAPFKFLFRASHRTYYPYYPLHRFDNQYNFPSFQILPPARFIAINIIHPLPGITRISRALDPQLGPQYRQVYFSLPVDPSFHHRAIESCPRSGTRALFCLAISPRESLMRNNIGQAVLSRLTAFIRPEIARETTNNCAVYQ